MVCVTHPVAKNEILVMTNHMGRTGSNVLIIRALLVILSLQAVFGVLIPTYSQIWAKRFNLTQATTVLEITFYGQNPKWLYPIEQQTEQPHHNKCQFVTTGNR